MHLIKFIWQINLSKRVATMNACTYICDCQSWRIDGLWGRCAAGNCTLADVYNILLFENFGLGGIWRPFILLLLLLFYSSQIFCSFFFWSNFCKAAGRRVPVICLLWLINWKFERFLCDTREKCIMAIGHWGIKAYPIPEIEHVDRTIFIIICI